MKDKFDRTIDYIRISVTDKCNLRCTYCMPESGIEKKGHSEILRLEEILQIVTAAAKLGISKVRLTGGEPLVRKNLVELIKSINEVEGINEITLTTNGVLLDQYLEELKEAGLSRINLSLDTLNPQKFKDLTRQDALEKVLKVIPRIIEAGLVPLKINVVLIGGFNDEEIEAFAEMTKCDPIDIRFIELMPIGEASDWNQSKFISNSLILEKLDLQALSNIPGTPAKYYQIKGYRGRIGLINPISCSFCSECNRIRVTSDGKIKPCLHSDDEIDLLHALRNDEDILPILEKAIENKPESHDINEENYVPIKRNMNRIGG